MLPELQATAISFATSDRFLGNLVGDFTAADWQVKDATGHDSRWLVGHLASTRRGAMKLVGLPLEPAPWQAPFQRGTSPADLPADLDVAALLAAFHETQALLASSWDGLTPEALAAPYGRVLPNGADTVGGALQFLAWHEAYHLGQLGLMRRLAGKPGLA